MFVPVDEISTRTLIYRQLPHLSLKITDLTVEAEIGILCYLVTDYGVVYTSSINYWDVHLGKIRFRVPDLESFQ